MNLVTKYSTNLTVHPVGGITVPLESISEFMLTLDALELVGSTMTLGSVSDDSFVSLDVSSTFADFHFASDALSIELWRRVNCFVAHGCYIAPI
jgi:hypothetical protein